jgi:hypothetical protein
MPGLALNANRVGAFRNAATAPGAAARSCATNPGSGARPRGPISAGLSTMMSAKITTKSRPTLRRTSHRGQR